MAAKYIKMHKIVDRTTLKILSKNSYTVEFIAKRMNDCSAEIKMVDGKEVIQDVNYGIIAEVIDSKVESGAWHEVEPVEFAKTRYEVESFYQEQVLNKK